MYSPRKTVLGMCAALGGMSLMTFGAAAQDICVTAPIDDGEFSYGSNIPAHCDAADIAALAVIGDLATFRQFRPAFRFGRISGPEAVGQDSFVEDGAGGGRVYSAFASVSGQKLGGGFDGSTTKLLLGADFSFGASGSMGVTLATSRNTTTPNGGLKLERTETLIGPYFGTELSNGLFLDGFVAFGSPEYKIENISFSSTKTIGGITLSGSIETDTAELAPFVALSGSREKLPSYTVSTGAVAAVTSRTTVLTVGSQIYFAPVDTAAALVQPFGGLEVDFASVKDDVNADRSYSALRVSGGAIFAFETGYLETKVEATQSSDNFDSFGVSAFYGLQF